MPKGERPKRTLVSAPRPAPRRGKPGGAGATVVLAKSKPARKVRLLLPLLMDWR
jgi:hypothetical protein